MSVIENSKLTVVGAGAVGSSVALSLLVKGVAQHVVLQDINKQRVEAEALDIALSLFRVIEAHMRDKDGYLEAFDRDYSPVKNEALNCPMINNRTNLHKKRRRKSFPF